VDWNGGIRRELTRLFGESDSGDLLDEYHRIEPRIQAEEPALAYREVMARVLAELAAGRDPGLPAEERDALGRSLPDWPIFAEVPAALSEARERGWKLAMLSNTDRDFIEASIERLGVPFDIAVVAGEIGSYKPAHRHWEVFWEQTGADRGRHVHVAQSHFHDVVPATELGLPTVWINRLAETGDPAPTRELQELSGLADVLDELVSR
jgi:2-haloacid dehalogenase